MPCGVICKSKKVALSSKSLRADGANKVCVNKLIRVLCSFLLTAVVYLSGFGFLTTITDKVIRLVDIIDVKSFEILSEKA